MEEYIYILPEFIVLHETIPAVFPIAHSHLLEGSTSCFFFLISFQVHYNKYYFMRNRTLLREIFTNSWGGNAVTKM